jgi:hypothetical protein
MSNLFFFFLEKNASYACLYALNPALVMRVNRGERLGVPKCMQILNAGGFLFQDSSP